MKVYSRREFLKLSAVALASLGFSPWMPGGWDSAGEPPTLTLQPSTFDRLPPEDRVPPIATARVTIRAIRIYREPTYKSERVGWRKRDALVDIIEEMTSLHGPKSNPRWYRVAGGYAHSAYLQRVEGAHLNDPLRYIPKDGQLGEVTVPYTQSMRYHRIYGWQPLYRLYFGSVYWITRLEEGPDGGPWYGLTDDRLRVVYYVPAAHLRPILAEEITPISPHVLPEDKRILVSLARQELTAYEGEQIVFQAPISSGIPSRGPSPNGIPTDTPQGNFNVSLKTPSRHMGDGELTADLYAYELPGVPWVSFFHPDGMGFHGTYWHDNFGAQMSHGCVNMRNADAKWLYRWTNPEIGHQDWYRKGRGTRIQVV